MANVSTADLSTCSSTAKIVDVDNTEEKKSCKTVCFGNIKMFTFALAVLGTVNGAIAAAYLPAVVTTLERVFELGSSTIGLVVGSYEIGATIAAILVSYLGHNGHIPRIIAVGTIIAALGSACFSIPHFISAPYSEKILYSDTNSNSSNGNESHVQFCELSDADKGTSPPCVAAPFAGSHSSIAFFILGQNLLGIGSAPILTIGITYIDNCVKRKTSGQYIAVIYATSVVGAVVGFGCGYAMLEVYVDIFTQYITHPDISKLNSSSETWAGAWWVGFLLFAVLLLILVPWLWMFPKTMPPQTSSKADEEPSSSPDSNDDDMYDTTPPPLTSAKLSDFPKATLKLLKNPVFMLINIGSVCEFAIVSGFLTFAAKYMETQFSVKESNASLILGGVAIPAAVGGVLLSGYLLKRFKIKEFGAMKLILAFNMVAMIGFLVGLIVGCDDLAIAGVTSTYVQNENGNLSIIDNCNKHCNCRENLFDPVCNPDTQLTYLSYCHAGCPRDNQLDKCSCITNYGLDSVTPGNAGNNSTVDVRPSRCENDCTLLPVFLVFLGLVSLCLTAPRTPAAVVLLRSVGEDLKSFALGIQVMFIRLLALLPSPALYGLIIDATCRMFNEKCGVQYNCLIYSNRQFIFGFQGISLGLHVFGTLMFFIAFLIMWRQQKKELNKDDNSSHDEVKVTRL